MRDSFKKDESFFMGDIEGHNVFPSLGVNFLRGCLMLQKQ